MSKSRDEIKGKRNNHLAANGLLKAKDGKTFDLTQYYIDNSPKLSRDISSTLSLILFELRKMNLQLQIITEEDLNESDLKDDI
tara:strand:+ start:4131 stop:4379 length:249 start_codon:yes stop_codon:yes gene_type:complete